MDMDLTDVIDEFASDTLTIQRRAAPTAVGGFLTSGTAASLSVSAVVYPSPGEDALILPEGMRSKERVAVVTKEQLRAANDPGGAPADTFAYHGGSFEVQAVRNWSEHAGYWWCLAVKVGG